MAFVFEVIASSILSTSINNVFGLMSTNTGFAPAMIIAFVVAIKVNGVVITSSPS